MSEAPWPTVALKYIANLYNGNSIKDDEKDFYTDPLDAIPYIATKDIDANNYHVDYENGMFVKNDDASFARATSGDVLLCLEGGSAGRKIARIDRPVAFVNKLCCIAATEVNPDFLYYSLQTNDFKDNFYSRMTGLIGGVSVNTLGSIKVPLPPSHIQTEISSYLDNRMELIDNLIELIEKSLSLDEERISSIISTTVTQGLDGGSDFIDSGVEWIGSIPSHWSRSRIGWIRKRPTAYGIIKLGEEPEDGSVFTLRCSNVKSGFIDTESVRRVSEDLSEEFSRTLLHGGEVLINVRGTLGGCAVVPEQCAGWNIAREVAMIDVAPGYEPRFVKYFLMGEKFWSYLNANLTGSVYQGLNIELLEHAEIVVPPLSEQKAIADYLDEQFTWTRNLIAKKNALLSSIREYRTALISEAVTGKFEVLSI